MIDELMKLPADELARMVIRLRGELADKVDTLKRTSRALRNMNRQRRSLKDTVKRRRKHGRVKL